MGIVGRNGGYTAHVADACVIIPAVHADRIKPHAEVFQAVVWHQLVSHPKFHQNATRWESPPTHRRAVFLDRDGVINEAVVRDKKPYPPCLIREQPIRFEVFKVAFLNVRQHQAKDCYGRRSHVRNS
jgi:hypothetical protein